MRIVGKSLSERLWANVDQTAECWIWRGSTCKGGYGQVWSSELKRLLMAHRAFYELLVGPIPTGLTLDHLCRNRLCVNPEHLEPVTLAENIRRGTVGEYHRRKTHCPHGHEYTLVNTYVNKRGQRSCKACTRKRVREAARRRRAHK